MRKITIGILAVCIMGIGLGGLIIAKSHGGRHFGSQGFPPAFLVEKIATELGLNEEQKTNAKAILEDSKTRIKPLMEKMKAGHEAARVLGTDGKFDEAKVNELASQQSETMKQLIFEKEKTKAQLFAILTPEQREKAKQMQEQFGKKMKGNFGHRFEGVEKSSPTEE
jgi:Spy/CpxP family protein refolding chaperone